jgi:NAD(P)-dependent dehydrogenase (short-subunit alcohol dehydrogenase family)
LIYNFKNKTVIVVGGTSGIGRAISDLFYMEECDLIYTGRSEKPTTPLPKPAKYQQIDLNDNNSIDCFINQVLPKIQLPIVLINNAGIQLRSPVETLNIENWNNTLQVNLIGPFRLIQGVIPYMKKSGGGRIVNIGSIAGLITKPEQVSYSASKAALISMTRTIAIEVAFHNILINTICPGTTLTPMVDTLLSIENKNEIIKGIPMGRFANPEEIAKMVLFFASDINTYMTGQSIIIDGGFTLL